MIDFDDPEQMTNGGQRIPIDSAETFAVVRSAAKAIYAASGRAFDADAEQQLERRVLTGMSAKRIVALTLEDRKARFDE